jgi:hypothetical protein
LAPKPGIDFPVLASSANRLVPATYRMRFSSFSAQYITPRLTPFPRTCFASNRHNSFPVAASRATAISVGVVAYNTPSTTIGVH